MPTTGWGWRRCIDVKAASTKPSEPSTALWSWIRNAPTSAPSADASCADRMNRARRERSFNEPSNWIRVEARAGLRSLREDLKNELRIGQDNDLFNFIGTNHDEWFDLVTRWSSRWRTSFGGSFYQRDGQDAGKFAGSVTRAQPHWGALTVGGAIGHDNGVIPRSEAFFGYDRGWRLSEDGWFRGIELTYGQHWYWYASARILTLTGMTIVYLPREWSWSLGLTGARSSFTGTSADWRPSGISRLKFPLARWSSGALSGNVFFAAGAEDFAEIDQIGSFAAQTYGGGLRFQFTPRQDVSAYGFYQKRTQDRTQTSFGLSYGIHF